jgi:NAD(P)-dependent dehydrogenase (short-subunit alcohol dehydrogenase family)
MRWSNQVAIITGGSRGIGRATALLLAQRGAAVCVNYTTRADRAEAVAREIGERGGRAIVAGGDVADGKAMEAMIERVMTQLGPVTILVNNAGISYPGTLETYDREQFERMRQVNVEGIIHTTRAVMGSMRGQQYGRIVNVTSIAALGTVATGTTFYAATKAAVAILTRRFAMELGPHGITVNAVAPGFVHTDMTAGDFDNEQWKKMERHFSERTMVGRIGQPEDIANAIAFLAAPESSWITAQLLVVDGGRMDYIGHG